MKRLTNPVFDWATCVLESALVDDYAGPVWLCKKDAAPPPNPYAVSDAQTKSNKDTVTYNNAITHGNTTSPFGSQTYTARKDPITGATVYDQSISLSPDQQALYDQQNKGELALGDTAMGMLGRVQDSYNAPIDLSGAGKFQSDITGGQDLAAQRQQVQDALYRQQASYLDPQYQQADTATRTRLANQGITEGSDAWKNSIDEFNRGKTFDYQSARNAAITGSGQEMGLLSNIANQQGSFHNNARANYIQELYGQRNSALNEFNALRGGNQITAPQFTNANNSVTNAPDTAGNIWNAYNATAGNANASNAAGASNTAAIGSVIGTAIMVF